MKYSTAFSIEGVKHASTRQKPKAQCPLGFNICMFSGHFTDVADRI
jgi:hypothetical protein